MWDQKTGRSRGFGFVSFRNQQVMSSFWAFLSVLTFMLDFSSHQIVEIAFQDAQSAINDLTGEN